MQMSGLNESGCEFCQMRFTNFFLTPRNIDMLPQLMLHVTIHTTIRQHVQDVLAHEQRTLHEHFLGTNINRNRQRNRIYIANRYAIRGNNIDYMIIILAGLLTAYRAKPNYDLFDLTRIMLTTDPWSCMQMLEKDYMAEPHWESGEPMYLQQCCVRMLCKPFLEDLLFEFCAYKTWLNMDQQYRMSVYKPTRRFRRM